MTIVKATALRSSGTRKQRGKFRQVRQAWETARWMVWAPDQTEPETMTIGHCTPSIMECVFAIELGRELNKRYAEDGQWLVAWTDPHPDGSPSRLSYAWIDRDGDAPFTVDNEEGIATIWTAGVEHFAAQGGDAMIEYRRHIREVEIAPSQMILQSAGQPMRNPAAIVPADFG